MTQQATCGWHCVRGAMHGGRVSRHMMSAARACNKGCVHAHARCPLRAQPGTPTTPYDPERCGTDSGNDSPRGNGDAGSECGSGTGTDTEAGTSPKGGRQRARSVLWPTSGQVASESLASAASRCAGGQAGVLHGVDCGEGYGGGSLLGGVEACGKHACVTAAARQGRSKDRQGGVERATAVKGAAPARLGSCGRTEAERGGKGGGDAIQLRRVQAFRMGGGGGGGEGQGGGVCHTVSHGPPLPTPPPRPDVRNAAPCPQPTRRPAAAAPWRRRRRGGRPSFAPVPEPRPPLLRQRLGRSGPAGRRRGGRQRHRGGWAGWAQGTRGVAAPPPRMAPDSPSPPPPGPPLGRLFLPGLCPAATVTTITHIPRAPTQPALMLLPATAPPR